MIARSSTEEKHRAMEVAICELIWIKQLMKKLKFGEIKEMDLCKNEVALHSASNPVFHERTKHIEKVTRRRHYHRVRPDN